MSLLPGVLGRGTFNGQLPTLHSARALCQDPATRKPQCAVNYADQKSSTCENNNLHIGVWEGDNGQNGDLNVSHGINSLGSDLLYHTETKRDAFAIYTQGVWDINQDFTLTVGIRYAEDEVDAEENLFRYAEVAPGLLGLAFGMTLFDYNLANGGVVARCQRTWWLSGARSVPSTVVSHPLSACIVPSTAQIPRQPVVLTWIGT